MIHTSTGIPNNPSDYYQALFENPKKNSVLLIDSKGIILEANRAFLLSFGYDREDVVGKHFSLLFSETDQRKDLPMREVRTVLDEGQSFDNNYLVNKNKVLTWVSGESVLLTNAQGEKYLLKIIQNIHTQKESEISITQLHNFNESILAAIEDAVLVLDKNFEIIKVNSAAAKLFSLSEKPSVRSGFREILLSVGNDRRLQDLIESALRSELSNTTIQLDPGKGPFSQKIFEVSCRKLVQENDTNALLVFRDITIQKNFEQQREDIMNFVAHELSNPLTNIILNIGLLQELAKEEQYGELKECIERSRNNAQRLKNLIGELYRSAKLATGNITLEKTIFDFDQMVDEATQSIRQLYPSRRITQTGASDTRLSADRDKLILVLTNFLTNAVKYSDKDAAIEVGVRKDGSSVIVSISDNGQGIPEKDLPHIFNRYYRVEKTKGVEGLGMGLFLSRQIIEAHQGKTWANSAEGKGSTFYFFLPIGADDP